MSIDHYENFPVASALCPPRLRPAVRALYAYARTADDLADEGEQDGLRRLADLAAYRADLHAIVAGRSPSPRWPQVFGPLAEAIQRYRLPPVHLEALLDAFEQDISKHRYVSREELLAYCERSANPVGRLMLHLYGIDDDLALAQSDAICTGLQLANFWQDLRIDTARGRLYVPLDLCRRHDVPAASLLAHQETPGTPTLIRELVEWAESLLRQGSPLVHRVPGRAGWELRLVVQGGLRILERIRRLNYAMLHTRPVLGRRDVLPMLWQAWRM
ncbi:MAG TPA: squalene synthase HpnC [Burkholderiaceae bacterium]|nr:squalene synthase HpnC [Burkholderiaceae bacterium]